MHLNGFGGSAVALIGVVLACVVYSMEAALLRHRAVSADLISSGAYACDPASCNLTSEQECLCPQTNYPENFPTQRIPMMVLATWDDDIPQATYDRTLEAIRGVNSSNGCAARTTYFANTGT